MSGKFAMKLVIDAVTSPLLYARLSAIVSPRERAAFLRSLAEAACRGETSLLPNAGTAPHRMPLTTATTTDAGSDNHAVVQTATQLFASAPAPDIVVDGHDAASIAEEFAGYF